MANDTDSGSVGQAKAEFDAALRRLETAQRRLQALVANPGDDEAALQVARSAYDHARLLWLSSEAACAASRSSRTVKPMQTGAS